MLRQSDMCFASLHPLLFNMLSIILACERENKGREKCHFLIKAETFASIHLFCMEVQQYRVCFPFVAHFIFICRFLCSFGSFAEFALDFYFVSFVCSTAPYSQSLHFNCIRRDFPIRIVAFCAHFPSFSRSFSLCR